MTREPRQSLTVIVEVSAPAACAAALGQARRPLEAAFAELPGSSTACLAVLPALPEGGESSLLFECRFEGMLLDMVRALLRLAGPEFCAVFAHCVGFPATADALRVSEFLSARACRSAPWTDSEFPALKVDLWQRARTVVATLLIWPTKAAVVALDPSELERRRGAVGMQDWQPGVPLLHVARVLDDARSRARVRRALRAIEQEPAPLERAARFILHGQRLLFLAYPAHNAQLWSEQVSFSALGPLTRLWADVPGFYVSPWLRRSRRARSVQRFLLDGRAPVAAWFNAHSRPRAV